MNQALGTRMNEQITEPEPTTPEFELVEIAVPNCQFHGQEVAAILDSHGIMHYIKRDYRSGFADQVFVVRKADAELARRIIEEFNRKDCG